MGMCRMSQIEGCLSAEAALEASPSSSPTPPPVPTTPVESPDPVRSNSPDPRFDSTDAYELSRLANEHPPPIDWDHSPSD